MCVCDDCLALLRRAMILILPCIDRQKEIQTISGKHESNGARYVNMYV
jgi:hypothetical protein